MSICDNPKCKNYKSAKERTEMAGDLLTYLLEHEGDIALEVQDYGDLLTVYKNIVGREPRKVI